MTHQNGAHAPVLNDDLRAVAHRLIARYPNKRSAVLPLLFLVQSVEGYVTENGMKEVAELLGLTSAQVLAAASFYTMLKKRPQGEYLVSVCRNISCTHRGARKVISALEEHLGVEAGGTTADAKFSLETAECLATCDGAPAIQVNYEDFYNLTPEKAVEICERLARDEEVRSERGDPVLTSKEISYQTATAGLRIPSGEMAPERTIGGESPRADTAPGFRPKEPGTDRDGNGAGGD
jgi:NADH-quinone oxidoreductase subunit E